MRLIHFLCLALFLVLTSAVCRAESVTVFDLGSDNAYTAPSINASGVVLVETTSGCSISTFNSCYLEFTNGQQTYISTTAPTGFTADNGTACAAPAGSLGQSVCNNGYQVYELNRELEELFPNGDLLNVVGGSADVLRLNSAGDFVVIDGLNQHTYQVITTTTPEPSSLALLGTGLIGACGVIRRRLA